MSMKVKIIPAAAAAVAAFLSVVSPSLAIAGNGAIPPRDPQHELLEAFSDDKYDVHLYFNAVEDGAGNLTGLRIFGTGNPDNWPERTFTIRDLREHGSSLVSPTSHIGVMKITANELDGVARKSSNAYFVTSEVELGLKPLLHSEHPMTVRKADGQWHVFHDGKRVNFLNSKHMSWELH